MTSQQKEKCNSEPCQSPTEGRRRLREFLRRESEERLFIHPTCHPSQPTGFCYCDGSPLRALLFYIKALFLILVFKLPYNGLKVRSLRMLGARIGKHVYFSAGVRIDPLYPQLITIEDNVFFGAYAKIFTHEFRVNEFRAGRVTIRHGAFIGGLSVIGCGVEIGEDAVLSACAIAARDVPARTTLVAAPSRIAPPKKDDSDQREETNRMQPKAE